MKLFLNNECFLLELALRLEEDTLVIKEKDINVVYMTSFIFDSIQVFDFVFFCDM